MVQKCKKKQNLKNCLLGETWTTLEVSTRDLTSGWDLI